MEFDLAVLGGGPGASTAAIRAAQLGARVACVEKEAELGGRVCASAASDEAGRRPRPHAHAARDINPKLGVVTADPQLDFAAANEWKAAVVKQMTGGVASLFKANNVTWFQGNGRFEDARSFASTRRDRAELQDSRSSRPARSDRTRSWLDSPRCVDSTGFAQTEVPGRLVVLGGGSSAVSSRRSSSASAPRSR